MDVSENLSFLCVPFSFITCILCVLWQNFKNVFQIAAKLSSGAPGKNPTIYCFFLWTNMNVEMLGDTFVFEYDQLS